MKVLLSLALFFTLIYLFWLPFYLQGSLGFFYYLMDLGVCSLIGLYALNHWSKKSVSKNSYKEGLSSKVRVDIFITTVNEPLSVLQPVLRAATEIDYPQKTVYLLDDGGREEVRLLAETYEATYLSRGVSTNYKAGNLNYGMAHSRGAFILVLDADQKITDARILKDLLPHFINNDDLAFISTKQTFDVPPKDMNHDKIFYEHMQNGKNNDNAAISVGSGVIYRRAALAAIGGFSTWNIVEDLRTSFELHRAGFQSLYINHSYTIGTAPQNLPDIIKQRGTWALDSLRLLIWDCPLFKKELTLKQRLHYFEIGYIYLVSALALPVLFILPGLALIMEWSFLKATPLYVILRTMSLGLIILFYYLLEEKNPRTSQFWAALSFTYTVALWRALRFQNVVYRVTPKTFSLKSGVRFTIPHFVILSLYLVGTSRYLTLHSFDFYLASHLFWGALALFWFYPFIYLAFKPLISFLLPSHNLTYQQSYEDS